MHAHRKIKSTFKCYIYSFVLCLWIYIYIYRGVRVWAGVGVWVCVSIVIGVEGVSLHRTRVKPAGAAINADMRLKTELWVKWKQSLLFSTFFKLKLNTFFVSLHFSQLLSLVFHIVQTVQAYRLLSINTTQRCNQTSILNYILFRVAL